MLFIPCKCKFLKSEVMQVLKHPLAVLKPDVDKKWTPRIFSGGGDFKTLLNDSVA